MNVWDLQRCVRPGWSPPGLNKFRYPFAISQTAESRRTQTQATVRTWPVIGRGAVLQIDREEQDFPRFSLVPFFYFTWVSEGGVCPPGMSSHRSPQRLSSGITKLMRLTGLESSFSKRTSSFVV